jgi:sulfatase modifying factor 1
VTTTRAGSILGLVTTVALSACSDEGARTVAVRSPAAGLPQSDTCARDRSTGGPAVAAPGVAARDVGVTSMQPPPTSPVVSARAGCLVLAHVRGTPPTGCFLDQVRIDGFCIDRYEAYVVEVDERGAERAHSPYAGVEGLRIRAKVAANVVPQAYISQVEASSACVGAGKSLCTADQFLRACRGPDGTAFYPYGGRQHEKGLCNEGRGSFVALTFGSDPQRWTYANFNDPQLNQLENGLARTGAFDRCASPEGVFDLVGNLHEWVDEPGGPGDRGHFRGGSYGDAEHNGPGCMYVTSAHERTYHDYTTGFRCCALVSG